LQPPAPAQTVNLRVLRAIRGDLYQYTGGKRHVQSNR
jgi:hypothetical protein